MKYIFFLVFTQLIVFHSFSQNNINDKASIYYLIRHAEKDRSNSNNKDPHLTEKGLIIVDAAPQVTSGQLIICHLQWQEVLLPKGY